MATRERSADTADRILDVAEELVQVRGFNAFSYADVARELGITKAALHYHYRGKAELGHALIRRYAERFAVALVEIESRDGTAAAKLGAYVDLYTQVLRARRMCLCGMLAAEYQTLPDSIRDSILVFFNDNEAWLARQLEEGRADGSLSFDGSAADMASVIIGGLEGAMLVARPYGDLDHFKRSADTLLATLTRAS